MQQDMSRRCNYIYVLYLLSYACKLHDKAIMLIHINDKNGEIKQVYKYIAVDYINFILQKKFDKNFLVSLYKRFL